MSNITEVIRNFPGNLQDPMLQFWEVLKEEIGVKREDFSELKSIVLELAEAQKRTENRIEELTQAQKELTHAQKRTEDHVEELTQAQKELTHAQKRTEDRVEELTQAQKELTHAQIRTEGRVEELAKAQKQTENRVEELAKAQRDTERSIQRLSDNIDFKLGGMGRRWGLGSESSFRRGLAEILSETGFEVFNYVESDTEGIVFGRPAEIEIDVIIKGGKTIVVEIKSSVSKSDVFVFMKKVDFYQKISGNKIDRLFMITPFIDDPARSIADQYQILICDSISDLGTTIENA